MISQYLSPNGEVLINGTNDDHILHDGYIMRWISRDGSGNVRIMTYGEGVNSSAFWSAVNTLGGGTLFEGLGQANADNVYRALNGGGAIVAPLFPY